MTAWKWLLLVDWWSYFLAGTGGLGCHVVKEGAKLEVEREGCFAGALPWLGGLPKAAHHPGENKVRPWKILERRTHLSLPEALLLAPTEQLQTLDQWSMVIQKWTMETLEKLPVIATSGWIRLLLLRQPPPQPLLLLLRHKYKIKYVTKVFNRGKPTKNIGNRS